MRLILTRHGQVEENLRRIPPTPISPLNSTGIKQATKLAERLKNYPLDFIYSSPYARSVQTADLIAMFHQNNFTIGKNYFLDERLIDSLESEKDRHLHRFHDFYREIIKKHPHSPVLVVSHATPMRILTCYSLGQTIDDYFDKTSKPNNTAVSEFIVHPGEVYGGTICQNCTKHLE